MIASLRGRIVQKGPENLVLDVQGVGYRVHIPLSTFYDLPDVGEMVTLHTHLVVRDDALELFGFLSESERQAFLSLLEVAGIGPRLARNILSGIRPHELAQAVAQGDGGRLRAIPGVGKRTAERILVDLRDKVGSLEGDVQRTGLEKKGRVPEDGMELEVLSALMNLGYRKNEVRRVINEARLAMKGPLTVESWVRESLRLLAKPSG
jgi:Holliday junction DNA helicase RuvA